MSAIFQDRALADAAVERLKAYAQPQRLMILSCLLRGEHTVSEIDTATCIGQPALSQQLAELRRAELVSTRKEARSVIYALADETTALCVRAMEAIFSGQGDPAKGLASVIGEPVETQPVPTTPTGAAAFVRIG
jgi:DNA-binding transcriptional ArsR family regulator